MLSANNFCWLDDCFSLPQVMKYFVYFYFNSEFMGVFAFDIDLTVCSLVSHVCGTLCV